MEPYILTQYTVLKRQEEVEEKAGNAWVLTFCEVFLKGAKHFAHGYLRTSTASAGRLYEKIHTCNW